MPSVHGLRLYALGLQLPPTIRDSDSTPTQEERRIFPPAKHIHPRAYALLAAGLIVIGLVAWSPAAPGVWHDDGVYLLLGKALADGEGLRYAGIAGALPAPKFPPLYPLTLSAIWTAAPDFPDNAELFQMANVALLVFAGLLYAWYAARFLALGPGIAFAAAVLAWLSPDLWRVAVIPLSEPLFLLTLLAALAAGARMEKEEGRAAAGTAAFVVLATLCFYTRTIGVVIWVAGVLVWVVRRRWRRAASVAVAGAALLTPWLVWSSRATREIPAPLRDILGSYGGWLTEQVVSDPGSFLGRLPGASLLLLRESVRVLVPDVSGVPMVGAAALALLLLGAGCWRLVRRSPLVVVTMGLYYSVLLVWPFYDPRLLSPVVPFLVLGALAGVAELNARLAGRTTVRTGVLAAACVAGSWYAGASARSLLEGRHDAPYRVRSEAMVRSLEAIREATPSNAVVGAPELWAAIHLYAGRTAAPSARFLPLARAGPAWGTPEEQYELWLEEGIDHVLVEHGGGVHGPALDRMDELCPGGAVELLASMRGAFLVRLNWDDVCREKLLPGG